MMRFPPVSIVISTYNRAKIISKTLHALGKCVYPSSCEIIVVNDGSKDETRKGLEKIADNFLRKYKKILKIINLQEPVGAALARNIGVEHSSYKIIVFLDDDCIPKKIASLGL